MPRKSPDGGIGRRAGLKHQWGNTHAGSIPALGTKAKLLNDKSLAFSFPTTPSLEGPDALCRDTRQYNDQLTGTQQKLILKA